MTAKTPSHDVYVVEDKENGFWTKVGAMWPSKDGGFTIVLQALPLGGRLVLRPYKPPKAE